MIETNQEIVKDPHLVSDIFNDYFKTTPERIFSEISLFENDFENSTKKDRFYFIRTQRLGFIID